MGSQLRVGLSDELHHLLHRPGRGVAAAEPGGVPSAQVPLRACGTATASVTPGVPSAAPALTHPPLPQSNGRASAGRRSQPRCRDSCGTGLALKPYSLCLGLTSVLSPFPHSELAFPLPPVQPSLLPRSHSSCPPAGGSHLCRKLSHPSSLPRRRFSPRSKHHLEPF